MKNNTAKQNIPSGWKEKSLENFLLISKGKLPKKTYEVADENSVPYLSIKHLDGAEYKYAHKSDGVIADKNDLLVIADGSGSGRMYRGYHGLVSSTFLKISSQSPSEISNDYLEVLFSHLDFTKSRFRKGGAIPHFDFKQLKDVDILVPPIKEQKKIAEILGTVNEDITKTQEVIEATEKLKRGLMQQLFTRGIRNAEFKVSRLGNLCIFQTGKLNSNRAVDGGKYPFFTCSQETFAIDQYSFDQKAILLAGNNAAGKYSVKYYNGKFDAYQRTYVISIKNEDLLSYPYLKEVLNTRLNELRDSSVGSTTKFLTLKLLESLPISLPPISEQREIAEILSAIDEKILVNKKIKNNLTLLKKGLMQGLLSGLVRVKV